MAVAQKFLFDQSFDGPGGPAASRGRKPITPAEPTFNSADLAAAETKGRVEGQAAGLAEAAAAREERVSATLSAIAERLAVMLSQKAEAQCENERQIIELTRLIVGKLFPALTRRDGFAEIGALVTSCLRECLDEPRLVLRIPDALFEDAQNRLAPLVATGGYQGKLVILAEEALSESDCRIEWADGGAERDMPRSMREIEAAMARALDGLSRSNDTTQHTAAGGTQETVDG
jgi:flagellar assembly protein FliH